MTEALPDLRELTFDRNDLSRVVLACIKRNPGLTAAEIANQIGAGLQSVRNTVRKLARAGDVSQAYTERGPTYSVPPPVPAAVVDLVGAHAQLDAIGVPKRAAGRPCTLTERLTILSAALDLSSTRAAMAALSGV